MVKNFNKSGATKALKAEDDYFCQVMEDGTIFAGSNHFIFKMTPEDYATIVQPVVYCEAGNWRIRPDDKKTSLNTDMSRIFTEVAEVTSNETNLILCPLALNVPKHKHPIFTYYNFISDFVELYSSVYVKAFAPDATLRTVVDNSTKSHIALVRRNNEAVGLIMPLKPIPAVTEAVRAYFTAVLKDNKEG